MEAIEAEDHRGVPCAAWFRGAFLISIMDGVGKFEKNLGFMRVPSGQRRIRFEMIASVQKGEPMKTLSSKRFSFFARLNAGTHVAGSSKSRGATLLVTLPLIAGMLCVTSSARANDYSFSVSGSGIVSSGTFQVSNTGPFGAYTVHRDQRELY
ncbi:MAG TPA: hypothetical protein VHU44_16900 [Acidobacteriaceae bacterium]|nr:hypothetical protein [Acidobacteriaceae bacterium]